MAFQVLELINGKILIADVYQVSEMEIYFNYSDEGQQLKLNPVYSQTDSLVLFDPMQLIIETRDSKKVVSYYTYSPHSEDPAVLIPKSWVVTSLNPLPNLLKTYNKFVLESKFGATRDSAIKKLNNHNSNLTKDEAVALLTSLKTTVIQ